MYPIALSQTDDQDTIFNASSKTFVAVPLISNNPTMETGFGAMAMYFFKTNSDDILSPPSVVTVAGLYSTNSSYYFVPMAKLYWGENKNRATLITGTLRINNNFDYNFEETDLNLVFSELRYFLTMEYSRKVVSNLYLGLMYLGTKTLYKFDKGTDDENEGEESFDKNWLPSAGGGLRFMISREKRINLRLDYAWGVDGNQGLYFGVMEAF